MPGFAPVPGSRIVLVGARDVGDAERAALAEAGVTWVGAEAFGAEGAGALGPALDALAARGMRRAYVHVDLDVHDPACDPDGRARAVALDLAPVLVAGAPGPAAPAPPFR